LKKIGMPFFSSRLFGKRAVEPLDLLIEDCFLTDEMSIRDLLSIQCLSFCG